MGTNNLLQHSLSSLAKEVYRFLYSNLDHTLLLKHQIGKIIVLIIYVDDMIITSNDLEKIARIQNELAIDFKMKNLSKIKYFLGIEVSRTKDDIFIFEQKYVLDLLLEVELLECKHIDTPII